ncbi:hypothetical protein, partial [Scytonema sp. PCC 10023]|uniref:hypothetical protein n=1 Tax=Scytonema sp. PCC 10023 TaxID=1680591 RepID=UPI0039C6C158
RYAPNWGEISLACRKATRRLCCYPDCKKKAIEAHHAVYKDAQGAIAQGAVAKPIAGREIPGVHVFALCLKHHKEAHTFRNWRRGFEPPPKLDSANTISFYQKLRKGFCSKAYP